jgi:hypothetical protein
MISKTDFGKVVLVIWLSLFLVSCGATMGPAMIQGEKWLDSKKDNPEINISGNWTSPEWGVAIFKQEGRELTGTLGDYPAKGVVSGSSIYLLMYADDKVHYFAQLKAVDANTFKGIYSKYYMIDENPPSEKPINLKRVSNP